MLLYVVNEGDSIDSIAQRYGISPDSIAYMNQISPPYPLAVGQALLLSADAGSESASQNVIPVPVPEERKTLHVGGYAYPFIDEWILEQTLPFLTDLYIFSYGFTPEGMLVPPAVNDTWMITLATQYGAAPILTLTPAARKVVSATH